MTNELDTLRPEVAEAIRLFGAVIEELGLHDDYESALHVLCAELRRLANENAQLRDVLADRDMDREMAAHANRELAALKAKMKPCARVRDGEVHVYMDIAHEGKEVAVVVVEE